MVDVVPTTTFPEDSLDDEGETNASQELRLPLRNANVVRNRFILGTFSCSVAEDCNLLAPLSPSELTKADVLPFLSNRVFDSVMNGLGS